MKVKIDDQIYDSSKLPIMIILSDEDKKLIANMDPKAHHFCSAPSEMSDEKIRAFMQLHDFEE